MRPPSRRLATRTMTFTIKMRQEDEYKHADTREDRKYSNDDSNNNPYRSMTTSQKNLNSGQQDYITLVGTQFTMNPRYNSVPSSTLPPHAQQNKPPSNTNNNNDYPSSIQQQIQQINAKSSSGRNRYPAPNQRQNNEYDQPPSPPPYKKPAAQSYPVPARAKSYMPQRQHDGYPPPPVQTLKNIPYAEEPVQQEYEKDPPSYSTKKKTRRPAYEQEEEEYERPRPRTRKSRKLRRPDRYDDEEEKSVPVSKSRRRRPSAESYDEEEYEIPKPKNNKNKKKSSQYAEGQESPSYEVRESVNDYIRSSLASGSGSGRRYESAGSSSAFSFATAPPEFRKTLLADDAAVPDLSSSVSAFERRDSVDGEHEAPDSRPMPQAEGSAAAPATKSDEVERKLDQLVDSPLATTVDQSSERKVGNILLPKAEVIQSINKAITEAVGRNVEVYDNIGSSRRMNKFDEIVSTFEAANYPHPYYSQSNPFNPLDPALPLLDALQENAGDTMSDISPE